MAQENQDAIGVIVASHCGVADEMLRATELIVGRLDGFKAISIQPQVPMDDTIRKFQEALKEVDRGKGVLILTDLFGGTPANIGLSFLSPKVEVVFGFNLPMLIKLTSCRTDCTLEQAAQTAKEYGRRHISVAGESLSKDVK
ncbi:MAG: PTS sugar transporter subunit IIA [Syntrophobacteraceae bacterium]